MGIPRPTGEYAGQMLEPGGWPEADEDTFYDRAQEYNQLLRQVTDVMDAAKRQQVEIFEGGVWSGGAANAANGALGTNLNEMSTLQDYLATVITWHRHIAGLIAQAKSDIGNNVDGAQREISILENDPDLEAEQRQAAVNELVRATHNANTSLVAETAEEVLASKNWKPPHNALADLLHQVTPPTPEVPTIVVPTPNGPSPVIPPATPFEPVPANPYTPVTPGTPVTPVNPTPFEPVPPTPFDPLNPTPISPITPVNPAPIIPVTPVNPVTPVTPGTPVTPITPVNPRPNPNQPVTPITPVTPAPAPTPEPAPAPAPVHPAPAPTPAPAPIGPPSSDQPSAPSGPGTTPSGPGTEPAHVKPAAATETPTAPSHHGAPASGGASRDDSAAAVAPAAAGGMPAAAPRAGGFGSGGGGASTGSGQSAGTAAASGAGSRAAGGRAPLGPSGKAPATATPRAASARTAPPARPAPPPERPDDHDKDKPESVDSITPSPSIPVSAARRARDAAAAAARRGSKDDSLRLARRIAAALNAADVRRDSDYGFFWITAVTTDGEIVVANSYGLAYIPDEVQLPAKVYMASADHAIPADEKARTATYPIMAVQGWAAYHDLKLRAVIGTAEQLANSDPGAAKIVLEDDDIPDSGKMTGRSRLEVVDPSAAAQLADTDDLRLIDLLPPAPAAENPPDDERHMFWFDLMKPMTSSASGREVAHLRAFHAFAVHSQELALHHAHSAADPETQRPAIADWMYWRYVATLLDSALTGAA